MQNFRILSYLRINLEGEGSNAYLVNKERLSTSEIAALPHHIGGTFVAKNKVNFLSDPDRLDSCWASSRVACLYKS
jgi:hypothetical protein